MSWWVVTRAVPYVAPGHDHGDRQRQKQGGLAPIMMDAIYDGLRKINDAGTALLLVEQQVDRVLDIASTAVVLEHGAVAYDGPAASALSAVEAVLASRGERAVAGVPGLGRTVVGDVGAGVTGAPDADTTLPGSRMDEETP